MRYFSILLLLITPGTLLAHAGHGLFQDNWLHFLTAPWHLVSLLLIMWWVTWIARWYQMKNGKRSLEE